MIRAEKKCCICEEKKPANAFHCYAYTTQQGRRSQRLDSRCKSCNKERRSLRFQNGGAERLRTYRAADPEFWNKYARDYRRGNPTILVSRIASEHKRRSKGWRNDIGPGRSAVEQALQLARFGDKYLDAYSGELIDDPTVDHIMPLDMGGTNDADNLCVTSRQNNSSKHNNLLIVWLALRYRAKKQLLRPELLFWPL